MDRARGLDHQPANAHNPAVNFDLIEFPDLFRKSLHDSLSKRLLTAFRLNLVFTRVVNHYDTVLVTLRMAACSTFGGASPRSRLGPALKVEHKATHGRKTPVRQDFRPIRPN